MEIAIAIGIAIAGIVGMVVVIVCMARMNDEPDEHEDMTK